MTITIPPELEEGLHERAAREGRDVDALAGGLLAVALAWEMPASEEEAAALGLSLGEQMAEVQRLTEQMAQDRAEIVTLRAEIRAVVAEAEAVRKSLQEMRPGARPPRRVN